LERSEKRGNPAIVDTELEGVLPFYDGEIVDDVDLSKRIVHQCTVVVGNVKSRGDSKVGDVCVGAG
jgi:hypothetical protein